MSDLIRKKDAIDAVEETDWYHINERGELVHGANGEDDVPLYKADDIYKAIDEVPGVETVLQKSFAYMDFVEELTDYIFADDDDYVSIELIFRKMYKHGLIDKNSVGWCLKGADDEYSCYTGEIEDDPQTDNFFRELTDEERKAVDEYIESISIPTGVNVFDFMDEPQTEREGE